MRQHKIAIIISILSALFIVGIIACNKESVSPPLQLGLGTYVGIYMVIPNYNLPPVQQDSTIDTMRFIFSPGNAFRADALPNLVYDSCTSLGTFLYKPDSLKITITESNLYQKVCFDRALEGDYGLIDNRGDSLIYGTLSEGGAVYRRIALRGR